MKRLYTFILMLFVLTQVSAQRINQTFTDANLPEVLKYINSKMKGGHVQFIFDDLDGIKINRTFNGQTPLEAVKLAIGAYPIKVTEDEGDIFVEYDKSIIKDVVLDNVTIYGTDESMSIVNYMRQAMRFSLTCPQEKVYLHLDNTGYFMGETIWFKAYVTNVATQERTNISQTLYVELINPDGEVLKTNKLYINNGEAEGSFKLEKMYTTGFYEIRAYTRYMLNWGSATTFSRVLPIFKEPKREGDYSTLLIDKNYNKRRNPNYRELSEDLIDKSKPNEMDNLLDAKRLPKGAVNVHFYPEGGNLVENLPSRVAFTINDSEGLHFDCSGQVVDENGNQLASAVTLSEGRGYFEITATDKPTYLQIKTSDEKTQRFRLPEPEQEGMTLKLNTLRDDYVTAHLSASRSMHYHLLGYVLMNQGRILTCDTVTCVSDINLKFERKAIPSGVNQLTVFDADGHILAERLFFICPSAQEQSSVTITTPTPFLKPCGKVELNIKTKPNASISLSAMDAATLVNGRQGNALTWMLLASDLKGYIEHPEYYFESDDRTHRIDADMLMMVQGWRRYDWDLMSGKSEFVQIYPIEDHLYLDGKLTPKKNDADVANVPLRCTLYSRQGVVLKGETVTDSVGGYAFKAPDMSGEWTLLFNLNHETKAKSQFHIGINRNFSPQPRYLSPYETSATEPLLANLFQNVPDSVYANFEMPKLQKRDHVLPEVKVKGRHRIYDNARASWESESQGQYRATIYYDVAKEVNNIIDRGEEPVPLFDWLYSRNPNFEARAGAERYIPMFEKSNTRKADRKEVASDNARIWHPEALFSETKWSLGKDPNLVYSSANTRTRIYGELDYNDRPIIWILNNAFAGITSSHYPNVEPETVLATAFEDFPVYLEEVKSIYICHDSGAYTPYVRGGRLSSLQPVTIFVYTFLADMRHHYEDNPNTAVKNLLRTHRRTYFDAYNEPETFQMDDYSALPPMEDFRRTIYWQPNIKTDDNGYAHVEFYNNSSARQLYISTEGLDREGRVLINKQLKNSK